MTPLKTAIAAIEPLDEAAAQQAQRLLNAKTKPRGSLGRLEEIACHAAAVYRHPTPPLPRRAIVVLAGDHGIAREGVSAYPAEVTVQMLHNFAEGGAAINVLARHAGAKLVVADLGSLSPAAIPGVRDHRVASGTRCFSREPAMTHLQALQAIEVGLTLAGDLHECGVTLLGTGDMGIGNTTAASALTAALTGQPVALVTGRGTGIDEPARQRKVDLINRALAFHRPDANDPLAILAALGGFEIAGLVGLVLGSAAHRMLVVLDGFITTAAALVAVRLCPRAQPYLLASHRSVEPGHQVLLESLALRPLLDLDLRLGEGTGAALAMPIIEAALRLLHEMASFEAAGVTDAGA